MTFEMRGGETWRNPFDAYRNLRDTDPVHIVDHPEHDRFWVLSRFTDVFEAARDTATFSSAQGLTPDANAMDMFGDMAAPIVMMDPPDHTRMRRLVSRPMTPRNVAGIEPELTAYVDDLLDRVADLGDCDIVETVFKPLPSFVVAHYLGVPAEDRGRFDVWTDHIVSANADGDISASGTALSDLLDYAVELMELRRSDPGDDLVTDLVQVGEDEVSAMWIVGFIFTMITGGNDTTTGLLGGAAKLLTDHRDQSARLLSEPGSIRSSIDEFLRLTSPVQNLARTTTRPVDLNGSTIPTGVKVMLVYGAANRDEREFGPTAEDLDVYRPIDKMLSLGYGAHHCLGAAAARLQGSVALERLLARFPDFEVDAVNGQYAVGPYVRRFTALPFRADAR